MNKYDNFQINIRELIDQQNKALSDNYYPLAFSRGNRIINGFRVLRDGFLIKSGLKKRLIYSNLDLGWFYDFSKYWTGALGGRSLHPSDFYFLLSVYRQKFQAVRLENEGDEQSFLKSWQDPRNIYFVLAQPYKFAFNPLVAFRSAKYVRRGAKVLEYGCGIAPFTQSLIQYYGHKRLNFHCADIPSFMFHYARWKLANKIFVKFIKIDPGDKTPLKDSYDIIFLTEVLEHLPYPLDTIKHLYEKLNKNGILVFDYIKSDAEGLDTAEGLKERRDVLEFIDKNFEVLEGKVFLDGRDVGKTTARKL